MNDHPGLDAMIQATRKSRKPLYFPESQIYPRGTINVGDANQRSLAKRVVADGHAMFEQQLLNTLQERQREDNAREWGWIGEDTVSKDPWKDIIDNLPPEVITWYEQLKREYPHIRIQFYLDDGTSCICGHLPAEHSNTKDSEYYEAAQRVLATWSPATYVRFGPKPNGCTLCPCTQVFERPDGRPPLQLGWETTETGP